MRGKDDRGAHFTCAMALVWPDGRTLTAEGYVYGEITHEKRGSNGFGYDPLFLVPELGLTTAELEPDAKNAISHRAAALHALVKKLEESGYGRT